MAAPALTLRTALLQGFELLEKAGISAPRLTAEVLLSHALHRDRSYLYAHPEQLLREVEWIHYGRYLNERLNRKPTQYITRTQEFYGRPFYVTPDVLIPRPETEHLVEAALRLPNRPGVLIDVGTGSGAIAVTLALEQKRPSIAIDLSPAALAIARRNAEALNAPVHLVLADSLTAIASRSASLIVSNPPYVSEADREALQPEVRDWEPSMALFAGSAGLDFYRRLIPEAAEVLNIGGALLMELGVGQAAEVAALFDQRWSAPKIFPDLAGLPRVLLASRYEEKF
jgi:release factor glutamine methyltransferase